jgi:protein gp37
MANSTSIEWTDATWNPVSGCTKISPGCDNCYAERFAERFRGVPKHPFENGFDLTLREHKLLEPLSWRSPRRIFVNSMSDLFHKEIPNAFLDRVFETMEHAHWHTFQILTKRSSLMRRYLNDRYGDRGSPSHMWFGVSIENRAALVRLAHLKQANARVRFISFEPLLEEIAELDLSGIHWAIVGGESGPAARGLDINWVRSIRDQCGRQHVAFFFKQWGGRTPKAKGNRLDGRHWAQYPKSTSSRPTAR